MTRSVGELHFHAPIGTLFFPLTKADPLKRFIFAIHLYRDTNDSMYRVKIDKSNKAICHFQKSPQDIFDEKLMGMLCFFMMFICEKDVISTL